MGNQSFLDTHLSSLETELTDLISQYIDYIKQNHDDTHISLSRTTIAQMMEMLLRTDMKHAQEFAIGSLHRLFNELYTIREEMLLINPFHFGPALLQEVELYPSLVSAQRISGELAAADQSLRPLRV
jgi:hypothetical protein